MRTHRTLVALALLALFVLLGTPSQAAAKYEVELANRTFTPDPGSVTRAEDSHLVIQFRDIPTPERREELREAGITLLGYVPNYAWTAFVRGGALRALGAEEVRAVFALTPEDKISRTAVGRSTVRVFTYPDVQDPLAVLGAYGDVVQGDRNTFTLRLSGDLRALASEDAVKYVAGPLPEKIENNDDIRDNINADEVQAAPYGLSGAGVTVGMWDNGAASTGHSDYASRLTVGDGSSTGSHPTLVCGVMAGDGTRSTVYGGYPYQWRGIATQADIASYSWPDDLPNMDSEHADAISSYDIVLSQNSWSWGLCPNYCEYYGEYDDWSQNYDKIVRGSRGKRISVVFSAGNDGDCSSCAGDIPDFPYGTIPGPGSTAKNSIVVGSNDADTDNLSDYSSMGPTLDGRLKPDVVAPGCKSFAGITTTYTSNNYNSSYCGTSFSCPAVSGCVALVQEDYIDKFGGEAWPSTVKALLIQGAEDKGNLGPDYQFGFGRVNIQNTIDVIRADDGSGDLIREDTLSPGEVWEYDVTVTPGGDLKVTLVWDDFEGDYGVSGKMLVNDLDLELEAPGGTVHHPWLLDPDHPSWVATSGVDDLNNVEQVEVDSPTPGTWTIRVTANVMPEPDQDFSVVTSFGGAAEDPPPEPPTGLGAGPGSGEGEIDLSWDPNSEPDLSHYRIERDDDPAFMSPVSFTTDPPYCTDSGLTPGQTYWYRVFAVDDGGNESGPSAVVFSDAQDLPPAAPTGLDAVTGVGEGEIDIIWNPNAEPDLAHYRLERCLDPGFGPGTDPFDLPEPAYHDSGLDPGETYYYRVIAVDAGGNESDPSDTDSAVAQDLPPSPPTGLTAIPGPGEGEIFISWNPNPEPDIDHYLWERATNPEFEPGSEPFEEPAVSYQDSGLAPGETYYYRVSAVDAAGHTSPTSEVASAVALDLAPAAPTGLVAMPGPGEGEIDLTWNASGEPDFDHYRLERCLAPDFGPGTDPFDLPEPAYHDSGLDPGETYYYRVIAVDANSNESDPSGTASAVATDLPPSQPTGLAAVTGAAEGEIDVSWNANPEIDIDHYRLERDLVPDFPDPAVLTTTETYYTDSGLIPGGNYFYQVIAVDLAGNESEPSTHAAALAQDLPPDPATNLVAVTGSGDGEIDVSWDASPSADVSFYRLQRDLDPGFGSPTVIQVAGTSHTDSGLIPDEVYYYRVIAVDGGLNESVPSNTDSAAAYNAPPSAPSGLSCGPYLLDGMIRVDWDENLEPDLDHYRLERDVDPAFPSPASFVCDSAGFFDEGLIPGDTYCYRVYAVDTAGNESETSDWCSCQAADLVPEAPTGLSAVPGPGEGEIFISWDANLEPDIDHYLWERATNPEFEPGSGPFEEPAVSYQDTELVPGETYYYRVSAVDATGHTSPTSEVVSAVALDAAPAAPTGLGAVTGPGEGEIFISWDPNPEPDIDHYLWERATNPEFEPGSEPFEEPAVSHQDSGLVPGDTYYYRVSAVDAAGNTSPPSDVVSEVALDLVPSAPTGLMAVPGPGDGEILISWDANPEPDIDHYLWERATNPEFEPGSEPFEEPAVSHQDSGLVPGETYYYRVSAVDATGHTSPTSEVASAVALDLAPAAPTGLTAQASGDWDVLLTWDANGEPDLDRYRLERDTTGAFSGPVGFETTDESYLDGGLEVGVTYYYRVLAIDAQDNVSEPSDPVSHLFEGTGVPEAFEASVSFVRPNPSSGEATVAYTVPSEGASVTMDVFDVRGRHVRVLLDLHQEGGAYRAIWDGRDARGEEVASGIYFFRVAIGDLEEVRKVVLIK